MARYKLSGGYGPGNGLVVNGANLDNQLITGKLGGQTLLFGTASGNNGTILSNAVQDGQVFFGNLTKSSYWAETTAALGLDHWHLRSGKNSGGERQIVTLDNRGNAFGDDASIGFGPTGNADTNGGSSLSKSRIRCTYLASTGEDLRFFLNVVNVTTEVMKLDGTLGITKHLRGISVVRASKTGTYVVTDADTLILADATSGAFDVTLPTAVGRDGSLFGVMRTSAANTVTVKSGGGTLNGVAAGTGIGLTVQYQVRWFISDGTNWFAVMGLL